MTAVEAGVGGKKVTLCRKVNVRGPWVTVEEKEKEKFISVQL